MDKLDIITRLSRCGVDHILLQIFGYLDCYNLRHAGLVSETWEKVILEGKLWEKLLQKNFTLMPIWEKTYAALKKLKHAGLRNERDRQKRNRKICCLISDELELLERNWKGMKYSERKSKFGPNHDSDYQFFHMNGDCLARIQYDDILNVRNRWTLRTEKNLEIPVKRIRFKGNTPFATSVTVNEHLIAVTFYLHPEIFVWNAQTKEFLAVLDSGPLGKQDEDINPRKQRLFPEGLCLWKNFLFSSFSRASDGSSIGTLRSIPSNAGEEIPIIYQKIIPERRSFRKFYMDEKHIVLFFAPIRLENLEENRQRQLLQIEVRMVSSFEITNSIQVDYDNVGDFHYVNGLFVSCPYCGGPISVWNVATGECVKKIPYNEILASIRLVADKYVVCCDYYGEMKIWDLQAALSSDSESDASYLIKTIRPPQPLFYGKSKGIVNSINVDEFQIAFVTELDFKVMAVYLYNFLEAAK